MNKITWQKKDWGKFIEIKDEDKYVVGAILFIKPDYFISYVETKQNNRTEFCNERFFTYLSAIRWANSVIREFINQ